MSNNLHRRVSFGLFDFEVETGELRRDGVAVKLAPQPGRVLGLLVSRPGEVIPRDEFRRELWGEDTFVDFERGLNFCMAQVRAALGDASENPRFIQTVPRRGYRFIAPVTVLPQPAPDEVSRPEEPPLHLNVAADAGRRPSRRRGVAAAAAIALSALAAVWLMVSLRPAPAPPVQASGPTRIAVLPFMNLTGDAGANYLADALTDEVITQLGTLSRDRLAVIARTSAMRYRDVKTTIDEIGRELDVQYVVEGSVRRVGSGIRISSRVVAVDDQAARTWWDEIFEAAAATDTQQTQSAIRIARHVATELLESVEDAGPPPTSNMRAWDAYLAATALMNGGTADAVARAVTQLEAAVTHDPSLGAAWARLAEAKHVLVMMGVAAPADAYRLARTAAQRAIEAAPTLASAHLANGLVQLWYEWRPRDAARSFERALALNPSLAAAHHDYAWALMALGQSDDAIRHITRARDLDPLSTRANNDIGWLYLHLRRPDDAARSCQRTLAIDAASLEAQACLERAYADRQLFTAALEAARMTLGGNEVGRAGQSDAAADGLREIWRWRLQRLERAAQTRWINPYTLAVHYVLTGDSERALTALEEAYEERVGMMVFMAKDPMMDPLRSDPRFDALVQKINQTTP